MDTDLKGGTPEPIDTNAAQDMVRQKMFENTDNVFLKPSEIDSTTWKEVFKDFEWDCEFEITGENEDKQAALTTLNTTLQLLLSKQGQPFTPQEKLVFNKILALTGEVSTAEIDSVQTSPQPQTAPTAAPVAPVSA